MQNLSHQNELIPLWAALLVYVYSALPIAIFSTHGPRPQEILIKLIVYTTYASILCVGVKNVFSLLYIFLVGALLEMAEIVTTHAIVNATFDLPSYFKKASKAFKNNTRARQVNDDFQLGCKYDISRQISPQEIKHMLTSATHGSTYNLKRYWLSYLFFQNLLSKIRGIPSRERSSQPGSIELLDPKYSEVIKCPFDVVEAEVALLYDFFYNRTAYYLYFIGPGAILVKPLPILLAICWCVVTTFKNYDPKKQTTRVQYHKYDVDIVITGIMIISITMLHILQLFRCLSSRWLKILLLRTYLERKSWEKAKVWDCCINKVTEIILSPKRGELFKPWQRKLGQYSLLDRYSYLQNLFLELLVLEVHILLGKIIRLGRKQGNSVNLCDNIKKAIIQTLKLRSPQLTNGIATLEATTELPPETKKKLIDLVFNVPLTDAELVLLWHIATSMCEICPDFKSRKDSADFQVATKLSKYCAYLVAFAPDLLPDNPTTTDRICTKAIWDACCRLENCKPSKKYDELLKIGDQDCGDGDPEATGKSSDYNILKQGAMVGKILCTQINDPHKVWKFLADFWAETILYLAPTMSNDMAHVERLEDGGEFITHLWALLFHAGIVDRHTLRNRPMDASSATTDPSAAASPRRNSI